MLFSNETKSQLFSKLTIIVVLLINIFFPIVNDKFSHVKILTRKPTTNR